MTNKKTDIPDRFEYKYFITESQKIVLLNYIQNFVTPDSNLDDSRPYDVLSLYFDTVDLKSYYEKYDGLNKRRKFRIRYYDRNFQRAFLEIKEKNDKFVRKTRSIVDFNSTLGDGIPPEFFAAPPPEANAFVTHLDAAGLKPSCWVGYKRLAYYARNNPALRITLDHSLSGTLAFGTSFPNNLLGPLEISAWNPLSILEIKFHGELPTWLQNLIRDIGLLHKPISKYEAVINRHRFQYVGERRWTH